MKKDHFIGLFALLFGTFMIASGLSFADSNLVGDPGPGVFPILSGVIALICGISILIGASKSKKTKFLTTHEFKRLALMFGAYCLYVLCLYVFGYIISTPLFILALTTMMAKGQNVTLWKRILYSLIVSAAVYALFRYALTIRLPIGILFS